MEDEKTRENDGLPFYGRGWCKPKNFRAVVLGTNTKNFVPLDSKFGAIDPDLVFATDPRVAVISFAYIPVVSVGRFNTKRCINHCRGLAKSIWILTGSSGPMVTIYKKYRRYNWVDYEIQNVAVTWPLPGHTTIADQ
ncbi:hypothetical protein Agabi119p4_5047 [Agaricus bisporus var. burnettii]|uniref:Uncharacterized protein n=1 Tax=Agaricus bisporus var. burnettii TaxID=192524 RepID=A0A8H7KHI4_AGABI|nr:hypothetical protein Agabi119p4_5047 [Agaricus bisporus var. burnettii]